MQLSITRRNQPGTIHPEHSQLEPFILCKISKRCRYRRVLDRRGYQVPAAACARKFCARSRQPPGCRHSVPPEVKNISAGLASTKLARFRRALSMAARGAAALIMNARGVAERALHHRAHRLPDFRGKRRGGIMVEIYSIDIISLLGNFLSSYS